MTRLRISGSRYAVLCLRLYMHNMAEGEGHINGVSIDVPLKFECDFGSSARVIYSFY